MPAQDHLRYTRVLVRTLVVLVALLLSGTAGAGRVGVVVTGDFLTQPVQDQAEQWLRQHGQQVIDAALPAQAIKTLADCFVIDDTKCSRKVVEARATADSVVAVRVEVTNKKKREIVLTAYWLVKGHNGVSLRRTCEQCTENVLRTTIDAMMLELAKLRPGLMGRVKVLSSPPGQTVLLDNAMVGVTPVERDIAAGPHELALSRDGHTGPVQQVTIEAGATAEVTLEPPAAPAPQVPAPAPALVGASEQPLVAPVRDRPSRAFPGVLIGVGVAGIGAGAALYLTSETSTGLKPNYRDTKLLGIGVGAGGAVLVIVGAVLMLRGGSSAPAVALVPGGAAVGWIGRF